MLGTNFQPLSELAVLILIRQWLPDLPETVTLSISGIFMFHCLHPPTATVALIVVLEQIHIGIYRYVLFLAMVAPILLVLAGASSSNSTERWQLNALIKSLDNY